MKKSVFSLLFILFPLWLFTQVGNYRNGFAVGVNGGYVPSNVGFVPKVTQGLHGGITGGLTLWYTSEKYFKTVCSVYAEVNYTQGGWKENIVDLKDQPVVSSETGLAEGYSRTINYIQVPIFAHLAWGKEDRGLQFFFQAGPQLGYMLNESTSVSFDLDHASMNDRVNKETTQYSMSVKHKFGYGIVAGVGVEYSLPKLSHILLDARYYYGLANIYGDTKRDCFAKSSLSNVVVKLSYPLDITKTNLKR